MRGITNSILPKAISYRWAFFFSFSNYYYYFSSLLKAKYQICTQGGGVDCIRLVLRLNFDFHQSKDVCLVVVVVVVCRKAASLFRGPFCYMMLTDIPLCIWLFALCFNNNKTPTDTIKRCTCQSPPPPPVCSDRGIRRDDCFTPDTYFFSRFFFFLWQRSQPLFYYFILQMVYSAVK